MHICVSSFIADTERQVLIYCSSNNGVGMYPAWTWLSLENRIHPLRSLLHTSLNTFSSIGWGRVKCISVMIVTAFVRGCDCSARVCHRVIWNLKTRNANDYIHGNNRTDILFTDSDHWGMLLYNSLIATGVKERKSKPSVMSLVCCSSCSVWGASKMPFLQRVLRPCPNWRDCLLLSLWASSVWGCSGTAVLWHLLGAGFTGRD